VSDQLSTWAVWSSQAAALELSTPTWMTAGGCAPATCQSLGQECGQPSNGCGGSLNCGSCGSGEMCSSGLCVDAAVTIPPPSPGDGSRPWAHNTGPSDPGAITPYTGPSTITTDGAVYENFSYTGRLTIDADNVTIRNFTIDGNGTLYALQVLPGATGFYAENGEIYDGGSALIYDQGTNNTFKRLHIHDGNKDGMTMHGSGVLVEGCFVEKIGMGVNTHPDAVANGATSSSNQTFRGNNFFVPYAGTPGWPGSPYESNAVFIFNDLGTYSNIVIDGNWINGGNYSIYCSTGMQVTNNLFGRDYNFGTHTSHKGGSCAWSNNRWEDTGDPL